MHERLSDAQRRAVHGLLTDLPLRAPYRGAEGVALAVAEIEAVLVAHRAGPERPSAPPARRAQQTHARALGEIARVAERLALNVAGLDAEIRGRFHARGAGHASRLDDLHRLAEWAAAEARAVEAELDEDAGGIQSGKVTDPDEELVDSLGGLWLRVTAHTVRRDPGAEQPFSLLVELCARVVGIAPDRAHHLRIRAFDCSELGESAALLASIPDFE